MNKWNIIKSEELPTNLIPYPNFREELDTLMIVQSLLGWQCEIERIRTISEKVYFIQFNKIEIDTIVMQVQLIIFYNVNETEFISLRAEINGLRVEVNHDFIGKESNYIQLILKEISGILNFQKEVY